MSYSKRQRQEISQFYADRKEAEIMRLAQPLSDEEQSNVLISYWQAIEAMTGGYAVSSHFDALVYALNLGVLLSGDDVGMADIELLADAMEGIRRTKDRFMKTDKFGLDGESLKAVRAAYVFHEAQIRSVTRGAWAAAIDEMHRRIADSKDAA